jgi:flagellar biosynthesis protein FlhB
MAEDSFQEKTEQPTEKRLSDAKRKGQVAQSPEVASCFVILFLSVFFYYSISKGFNQMFGVYVNCVKSMNIEITPITMGAILLSAVHQWLMIVIPIFAILITLAVLTSFAQTGFIWSFEAMKPKFEMLDPIKGIGRMFSKKSFFEVLKSVIKLVVLIYIVNSTIRTQLPSILSLADKDTTSIVGFIAHTSFSLAIKVGIVFLFVAGLDFLRQKWQYKRDLMMTQQEVKEEAKEREGNPLVKSRIRTLQRDIARRRMVEDVKKADLILTNPTTYAVAIRYTPGEMPAPTVVAKGGGFVAERIKEVARAHGVTIIENKPVARALFFAVKIGDYIPEKFYVIVAELLAQVYKQRSKVVL